MSTVSTQQLCIYCETVTRTPSFFYKEQENAELFSLNKLLIFFLGSRFFSFGYLNEFKVSTSQVSLREFEEEILKFWPIPGESYWISRRKFKDATHFQKWFENTALNLFCVRYF